MGDLGQGGVRHREHVSPLGVLVVGRSAHLNWPPQLGLHFRSRGVRFVGAKDCGAATRELEDGASAVRSHDHAYFW